MELDVKKYAHVPFEPKGRTTGGWDCWGLVYCLYRDHGVTLPLYCEQYANTEDAKELGRLIGQEKAKWLEVKQPQPWDVVVTRLKGEPMHCGLYIGNGKMLHCMSGVGTTVERLDSITWRHRIVGYYRYGA